MFKRLGSARFRLQSNFGMLLESLNVHQTSSFAQFMRGKDAPQFSAEVR